MPKLKKTYVEIHPTIIREMMKKWSDESKAKFNDYLSIPDCVIERVSTSLYHQLNHRENKK